MTGIGNGSRSVGGSAQRRRFRVVASDLDGTLVRTDGSISDRTRAALHRAEVAGALVIFVTGRPPRWMKPVVEATGASGLAICANGALVYDLGSGEIVREHALQSASAARLVDALREALPGVQFAVESGLLFGHEPGYEPSWPNPDRWIAGVEELIADPVSKLLVKHPERPPEEIHEQVVEIAGEEAMVTYSGNVLLEVSGAGVSKASTLAALCEEQGHPPQEVLAFGDMPNDVPMLEWAGCGVAVGNAHEQVLAIADEITASNDDDGVALVLERLFPPPRTSAGGTQR
jgi:Cof subfamily protein (haloacid dehalogenase superfamily)